MMPEYWNASAAAWVPVESVRQEPEVIQQAIYNAIQAGQIKVQRTRLSPEEAWKLRKGDRAWKLPAPVIATEVMGLELAVNCHCDGKLQLRFKDDSTLADSTVTGILDGGGSLTRGQNYLVWINPFDAFTAYVADLQGRFIGTARVAPKVCYADQETLERELGVRQAAIAAERKRLQPAVTRMQMAESARARKNATAILGEDPALSAARQSAAAHELEKADDSEIGELPGQEKEPNDDIEIGDAW